jgi:mannose-6-phosphate isomerase-like protein (cupin superfamily)
MRLDEALDIDKEPAYHPDMDKLPVEISSAECLQLGTDRVTILATSEDTNGALFAVEVGMPPGGGPPVMHRHDPGEIYYVLEGAFTFYVGLPETRRVTATVGDVVPLAGRTPHSIRNETTADAVAFVVHAPGAPMENFSRAVAALAARRDRTGDDGPSMDAVLTVAAQNGIELLGPIPDLGEVPDG